MELSSQKKIEAKKYGCTVQELVFADLLSLGYGEMDAYIVAYPEDMALSIQMQNANRKKILSKISFVDLCEKRKLINANILKFSGDTKDIQLIDNEMAAKELLKVALTLPEGSKERGEMFMKYADLSRKNDQKTEETTEAINFYFPVKCHQCPLLNEYNSFIKGKKNKEVKPIEMEGIIRNAATIIEKARKKSGD